MKQYEVIIESLTFIKQHLSEPLEIKQIADHAGYSEYLLSLLGQCAYI